MLEPISIASLGVDGPLDAYRHNVALFGHERDLEMSERWFQNSHQVAEAMDRLFLNKTNITEEDRQFSREGLEKIHETMRRYHANRQAKAEAAKAKLSLPSTNPHKRKLYEC